ncbi:hypothetical protein IFM12275_33070 [Nocardia sputorum]|nr:hypothetical protein IFM12275_33070 [Nocardia sputorum]
MRGELAAQEVAVLELSALRGIFSALVEDQVTFVMRTRSVCIVIWGRMIGRSGLSRRCLAATGFT